MFRALPYAVLVTATLALAVPAQAQQAPPAVSAPPVEDLVREVLENNPSVAALRERVAAAQQMVAPAGALPDPMVEVMGTEAMFPRFTLGEDPMSMLAVEVRQALPGRGKRAAAGAVARADAATREREVEALRRQVARDLRTLYARVWAMDQELKLLEASGEMLDLLATTTRARYGTNQATQEAVIKAQIAKSRLAEQKTDLRAERNVMVAMIGRLLNREGPFALGPVESLPTPAFAPGGWEEAALAASADIAASKAAVEAAERRVEQAKLELKPNFSAGSSVGYRESLDPVVTVRFGVELPLWKKKKQLPMIRAAERELEMARQEQRMAEAMVRESVRTISERHAQAADQVRRYREGLIPQAQAALNAARAEYLAGMGDFSMVIEDFNMWLDVRMQVARREADVYAAWAAREALVSPAVTDAVGRTEP